MRSLNFENMKHDIESKADIEILINAFYDKVLKDELIGPFFNHLDFNKHLPKWFIFGHLFYWMSPDILQM